MPVFTRTLHCICFKLEGEGEGRARSRRRSDCPSFLPRVAAAWGHHARGWCPGEVLMEDGL